MVGMSNVSACHISSWLTAVLGMKLHPTNHGCPRAHAAARSGVHRPLSRAAPSPTPPACFTMRFCAAAPTPSSRLGADDVEAAPVAEHRGAGRPGGGRFDLRDPREQAPAHLGDLRGHERRREGSARSQPFDAELDGVGVVLREHVERVGLQLTVRAGIGYRSPGLVVDDAQHPVAQAREPFDDPGPGVAAVLVEIEGEPVLRPGVSLASTAKTRPW